MRYLNIIIPIIFVLSGCSFKPDMPKVKQEYNATSSDTTYINKQWWRNFNDPHLNRLVKMAFENNSNLSIALLNMQSTARSLGLTNKSYLPNLTLSGSGARAKTSGQVASTGYQQVIGNDFSLSGVLSYELDLWGRVRNSSHASEAIFKATKYDFANSKLSIAARVAMTYFNLISYKLEEDILRKTIQTYKDTMDYQSIQFTEGAISELTYYQSVSEYQRAKVQLSTVLNNIDITQSALALLVGEKLDDILNFKSELGDELPQEVDVPSGIGADVLMHRPDVASAYEKIKSANYLVGVARAAYLPTISLTGAFGFQSDDLSNFFKTTAQTWSVAGSIAGPLLDFGRTSTNVDIAKINQDINVKNYELTVKTALSEVRQALDGRKNALNTQTYLGNLLNSQEKVYKLSKDMYDEGYTTHLDLLDAQRNLLSAKLQFVEAKLGVISSVVSIYKAFGGGFETPKDDE